MSVLPTIRFYPYRIWKREGLYAIRKSINEYGNCLCRFLGSKWLPQEIKERRKWRLYPHLCVCCCKFTILKDDLRRHGSYHSISPKSAKGNSLIVVCRNDFSVSRGGLNDVKCQVQRVVHKKRLKDVEKNATISDYWGEYSHLAHSLKVTSAELAMVQFIYIYTTFLFELQTTSQICFLGCF